MTKVQEIFETIKEKHGDKFKPEQLNAWANMIQMQKHASLGDPPTGRFFVTQKKSREVEGEAEATLTPKSPPQPAELSPVKRANLRSQCLEQLKGCMISCKRVVFQRNSMKDYKLISCLRSKSIDQQLLYNLIRSLL